jgi:hypothetical protein
MIRITDHIGTTRPVRRRMVRPVRALVGLATLGIFGSGLAAAALPAAAASSTVSVHASHPSKGLVSVHSVWN